MKRISVLLLVLAALIHSATLIGWRWQMRLTPYFFDATVLSGRRGLDFYSIYQAGYNARHGADVYEGDPTQTPIVVPYFTPYRYLPVVAYTVGAALSLFAPLTAYKIWVVVIEMTLLGCVILTWWLIRDPDRFAPLAFMWLCFTPYYLELFMGQFSLVQGGLIFGMLILTFSPGAPSLKRGEKGSPVGENADRERAGWRFDWLWLASVLWKINTIILVPVLLRLRRFRILAAAVLVVAITTLPYFLVFPAHTRDFLANNFGNSVFSHELGNLGFRQMIFEILAAFDVSPTLQHFAQRAVIAVCLGAALLITFYSPRRGRGAHGRLSNSAHAQLPTTSLVSLWLVAFFLVSPQIWEHHYVMLLPALVVAYWQNRDWFIILIWLVIALPTPFGFIGLQPVIAANHALRAFALEPVWQPLLQHVSKAAPALALFVYFAWKGMAHGVNQSERVV